jgi:hypothetical protein
VSTDNNTIFLEFWQQYVWKDPAPLYFRLYHDEHGRAVVYSQQDLPGTYIDITAEQFALADMRARVVNGGLVLDTATKPSKLIPADHGTACDPRDVTVVVKNIDHATFWRMKNHESS